VAEVNAEDLDAIRQRRQRVRVLQRRWDSTWTQTQVFILLDYALDSADDIDTLLAACESGEK
jgi:hypothetical protein